MNKIEDKIDELFNELESTKLYEDYLSVKTKLENNQEIMSLITQIKNYQKKRANSKDKCLEQEISTLYDKLNSYPLYQSYLIIKDELEQQLFMIKDVFEKYFASILKLS